MSSEVDTLGRLNELKQHAEDNWIEISNEDYTLFQMGDGNVLIRNNHWGFVASYHDVIKDRDIFKKMHKKASERELKVGDLVRIYGTKSEYDGIEFTIDFIHELIGLPHYGFNSNKHEKELLTNYCTREHLLYIGTDKVEPLQGGREPILKQLADAESEMPGILDGKNISYEGDVYRLKEVRHEDFGSIDRDVAMKIESRIWEENVKKAQLQNMNEYYDKLIAEQAETLHEEPVEALTLTYKGDQYKLMDVTDHCEKDDHTKYEVWDKDELWNLPDNHSLLATTAICTMAKIASSHRQMLMKIFSALPILRSEKTAWR